VGSPSPTQGNGAGGAGSGGQINNKGGAGAPNLGGGNPMFIFDGGAARSTGGVGNVGGDYGTGGGGALSTDAAGIPPYAGGAGAVGCIIVEEFY
jgi:hypothetical protein